MAGVDGGKFLATLVNFCPPGVNLCPGLVSVGACVVAGGVGCASAVLRGERHGAYSCSGASVAGVGGSGVCAAGESWGVELAALLVNPAFAVARPLDQLVRLKEERGLALAGFGGVGAVNHVAAEVDAEIAAD